MGDLKGQIAVVTGAAQGLGLAIVEKLARQSATVIILDIQCDKAKAASEELVRDGMSVEAAELDITDSNAVTNLFNRIEHSLGHLDILVNNAGVGQVISPIVELSDEEWNRVLRVTLSGTFYCSRAAGRIMERQGAGCIVNIASINGQNPAPLAAAYNCAKAGVISLTRTLSLELAAYGVRVNAVSPGPVYTDFNKDVMAQRCRIADLSEDQMIERIRGSIPLGRWGEPHDIAAAVGFLCSAEASWITGEVLRVSGGMEGVSAAAARRTK
jgi:NAD(P)-dependent dehydrogenase (short-subunit alcohol dehydrogenase family)